MRPGKVPSVEQPAQTVRPTGSSRKAGAAHGLESENIPGFSAATRRSRVTGTPPALLGVSAGHCHAVYVTAVDLGKEAFMTQAQLCGRTIVAGVDYSELSDLALNQAFELTTASPNVELHVIHVVGPLATPGNDFGARLNAAESARLTQHVQAKLDAFLREHPTRAVPERVLCHVRAAEVADAVAALAEELEADLIIVGTHGRRAVSRLVLGSVAEVVTRLAPCPVLVVRPKAVPAPGPRIEPPCPRCIQAREHSGNAQYWCAQHRERHGRRHTYHQGDRMSSDSTFPLVYNP